MILRIFLSDAFYEDFQKCEKSSTKKMPVPVYGGKCAL